MESRVDLDQVAGLISRHALAWKQSDLGTGIPTAGNTHEVAQAIAPETRVVYVDYDRCKLSCAHDCGYCPDGDSPVPLVVRQDRSPGLFNRADQRSRLGPERLDQGGRPIGTEESQ